MTGSNVGRALRDRTREELLDLICRRGELTRAELVALTGMSRSTINQAVGRLLADGRIAETVATAKGPGSGRGRPAVRLAAVVSDAPVVGIDFGHSHVQVGIADSLGRLVESRKENLDVDLDADRALTTAVRLLATLAAAHSVTSLGAVVAGVPGPIDAASGVVCSPTILSGWVGRVPAQELARLVDAVVPIDPQVVHVENDAVLGAVGVAHADRRLDNFIYVKASHGIGAGVVIDGRPYRGAAGLAGEIGHTTLAGHTQLCRCGSRGCLEAVISVGTLYEQIAHTRPGKYLREQDLAALDDPIAVRVLTNAGRLLGRALADHVNMLNPQAVVIGGELGRHDGAFTAGVRESIEQNAQPATAACVEVRAASSGVDPELGGALAIAADKVAR